MVSVGVGVSVVCERCGRVRVGMCVYCLSVDGWVCVWKIWCVFVCSVCDCVGG